MANLYGVANPVVNLGDYDTIGGANVSCPAGVETNIFQSSVITALDHGVYYPVAWTSLFISFGATQSTTLTIALRVNNGADIVQQQLAIPVSAGGTNVFYSFNAVGPPLPTSFWPPGSVIQVSVLAGGFAVTVPFNYSKAVLGIFRSSDL